MIYVTGDTHRDYHRFNKDRFSAQSEMAKQDYVIICGDFGIWDKSPEMKYWLKWLEDRSFTTLFVDGNHENYDLLAEYPVEIWNGGKVQKINESIIHLMRGQVYRIQGKKFFTFGGARSHDIQGGILDKFDPDYYEKVQRNIEFGLPFRVNHYSWWKEEMPNKSEMAEGIKNLERVSWSVDYIITHCAPTSTQALIGFKENDECTNYLEGIKNKCSFREWFFGHYHIDCKVEDKMYCVYGEPNIGSRYGRKPIRIV